MVSSSDWPTSTQAAGVGLLADNDLGLEEVSGALGALTGGDTDFADLYFEHTTTEVWAIQEGKVTLGAFSIAQGVGARAVSGDQTAFAYSSDMSPRALRSTVGVTREMHASGADAGRRGGVKIIGAPPTHSLYPAGDPVEAMGAAEKIAMLQEIDRQARAMDPRIVQVTASMRATHTVVLVAATDGTLQADARPLIEINLDVLAEENGKRARGSAQCGGRYNVESIDGGRLTHMVGRATHIALVNLQARPAPAGVMSVVLGPGFPGVLLHEAIGHGLEGDAHRKRSSVFIDRLGSQIAAPAVTVIDDGTIPGARGSLNMDDEGSATQCNVLIEKGRFVGLMQDKTNSRLMNARTTGNARRMSYANLPMPRMTNTFLAAGEHDPEEIIASVKTGLYARSFGGGQVDITSGQFNFSATEAYLIEDGRITAPVQGATLIGLGHEALMHVSMIGDDLELDSGVCGKNGQSVPVCVGQPTVRIDEMIVGGATG